MREIPMRPVPRPAAALHWRGHQKGRHFMTEATGRGLLICAFLGAVVAVTMGLSPRPLHAEASQPDAAACEAVNQHYLLEREQLNARILTDLLFEATQKDCAALVE